MPAPLEANPTARTYDIEELVKHVWDGRIRIPNFQRDFRWTWDDARKLFDSVVRGYPVGNLLLWTRAAPRQHVHIGALDIDAPELDSALWVVDGQQRLTTLANVLHKDGFKDPRFSLSYNLKTAEFTRPPRVADSLIIPLPIIFDLQELLKWFAEHADAAPYLDDATAITRKIRQFEIPAYLVAAEDPNVLQDIFDRMNNYGKRLKRAEVFSALYASAEDDPQAHPTFDSIANGIERDFSFGRLSNDTVLASILARRGPEVRREIRTEFSDTTDEGQDQAYLEGEKSLRKAIQFLQNDADVPHVTVLAYQYLVVVLTRFFSINDEITPRHLTLLRRWYWQAALAGPQAFKGGTPNAARILCGRIDMDNATHSINQLLQAVKSNITYPNTKKFSAQTAATRMVLCGLWTLKPRDPVTGKPFAQNEFATLLEGEKTASSILGHMVPREHLPPEVRSWTGNRLILLGDNAYATPSFLARPLDWTPEQWKDFLNSHLITCEIIEMFNSGNLVNSVSKRQEMVDEYIHDFFQIRAEPGYDTSGPLNEYIVEDLDSPEGDA